MASRAVFTALTLALVAASGQATINAQRVCTRDVKPVAYRGFSYSSVPAVLSPDDCQAYCARTSTCVAYMLFSNKTTSCSILRTIRTPTILTPSDYGDSWWITGRCGAQLPQLNGDFPGNDLSNVLSPSAVECSYTCEDTTGCFAYTWSTFNGGTCWMKTDRSAVSGPSDGSAVSGEVFKCSYETNSDVVGADLSSVQRSDWRDCCNVCRKTPGCKASSWTDYNGGTCWLKKKSTGWAVKGGAMLSFARYGD